MRGLPTSASLVSSGREGQLNPAVEPPSRSQSELGQALDTAKAFVDQQNAQARAESSAPRSVGFDLSGTGKGAGTVAALLSNGQRLLEASPALAPKGASAAAARQAEGYRRQLDELEALVEDNLRLAQQVADAEMAVMLERFRVLFEACADNPKWAQEPRPGDRLIVAMAGRRFHVPLSEATWRYVLEGPCRCPLPPPTQGAQLCTVDVAGLPAARHFKPVEVDANIMAAALREWSRQAPHTVAEDVPPEQQRGGLDTCRPLRFHASSSLWWTWPSPVARHAGVPAASLFADASDGTDAAIASALHAQLNGNPGAVATLEALGLGANSPVAAQPGFWSHLVNHWDALTRTMSQPPSGTSGRR